MAKPALRILGCHCQECLPNGLVQRFSRARPNPAQEVLRLDMVDKSTGPRQTHFGRVFVMRQSMQAFSSQREAPSELFCRYLRPIPHNMIQLPPGFEASQAESGGKG
jgi:hypothetical protein